MVGDNKDELAKSLEDTANRLLAVERTVVNGVPKATEEAMENATFTGLISIQPGTFLRRVCANREATPRRSFVIAFQSSSV